MSDSAGPSSATAPVSLYHVRREQQVDGPASLHWAHLGDVNAPERNGCQRCGRPLEQGDAVCPNCGHGIDDGSEVRN